MYMREFERKLDLQAQQATDTASASSESPSSIATKPILQGLRIYVNGYTKGTNRSEIVRLVSLHGGVNL